MRIDFDAGCRERARRDPSRRLLAQIEALAGGHGVLLRHAQRPWASVTFAGSRHEIALAFTGAQAVAAGELLIAALPEHEFAIAGQLVADASVTSVDHLLLPEPQLTVAIELLLLEDG